MRQSWINTGRGGMGLRAGRAMGPSHACGMFTRKGSGRQR